jgi:prephenate dehydrogenase
VQAGNPYAPEARDALADGLRRLAEAVEAPEELAAAMADLRRFLGSDLEHHLQACARAFAQTARDDGDGAAKRPPSRERQV